MYTHPNERKTSHFCKTLYKAFISLDQNQRIWKKNWALANIIILILSERHEAHRCTQFVIKERKKNAVQPTSIQAVRRVEQISSGWCSSAFQNNTHSSNIPLWNGLDHGWPFHCCPQGVWTCLSTLHSHRFSLVVLSFYHKHFLPGDCYCVHVILKHHCGGRGGKMVQSYFRIEDK